MCDKLWGWSAPVVGCVAADPLPPVAADPLKAASLLCLARVRLWGRHPPVTGRGVFAVLLKPTAPPRRDTNPSTVPLTWLCLRQGPAPPGLPSRAEATQCWDGPSACGFSGAGAPCPRVALPLLAQGERSPGPVVTRLPCCAGCPHSSTCCGPACRTPLQGALGTGACRAALL